ncbi:Rieske 2Fe-2S domain-containing protein [Enemella sp. A6]|uniref:Rieske 2Fe-2S domain-containing protein n=1 Tax=Enemella sp. A6 TaxID=3440152 RepID=UPI003EBA1A0F
MGAQRLVPGEARFPKNAWYVAAFAEEVTTRPMHRLLVDADVVLYRTADGTPVALMDRCPHRGYPLSEGGVTVGDNIQCQYHGLQFGPDGHCRVVPSGDRRPERIRVRSYPLVERYELLWIWVGDPEACDPDLIPDYGVYGYGAEGMHYKTGIKLEIEANYLLQIDNLLDATHITYLHEGQIDTGDVAGEPLELFERDGRVFVRRTMRNEEQAPLTMKSFGFAGGRAHRTVTTEAWPPSLCGVLIEFEEAEVDNPKKQTIQLIAAITPQDRTHTLVFTTGVKSFPPVNPNENADSRALLGEDAAALEAIQRRHDKLGPDEWVEFGLPADQAQYRARQIIQRMLQIEDGEITAAEAAGDKTLQATVDLTN